MTRILLESIGLCAHYSPQGDWAFDFAFGIAREKNIQLNVFHFLADPFDPEDRPAEGMSKEEKDRLVVERERKLRFYYDRRLGEHLKAGFRVCENNEWTELHQCLLHREFQLLVLPCPGEEATFGARPLLEFVRRFVSPVALIGPDRPDRVRLNRPAKMIIDQVGLPEDAWSLLDTTPTLSETAGGR